ncbi:hypothetical protein UC34_21795 [Pandoraea vervacti]|uniref:Uncharacterized protein n=1 Tax=Pandoraea vervacti TaxID=656178 RepID=A0ABM5T1Z8_9BURK|nr:hypothetical protein UC34_21795 [Pandoraea vervacti]
MTFTGITGGKPRLLAGRDRSQARLALISRDAPCRYQGLLHETTSPGNHTFERRGVSQRRQARRRFAAKRGVVPRADSKT